MWLFSLSLSVIGARTQTLKTVKHYPRELVFRISFFFAAFVNAPFTLQSIIMVIAFSLTVLAFPYTYISPSLFPSLSPLVETTTMFPLAVCHLPLCHEKKTISPSLSPFFCWLDLSLFCSGSYPLLLCNAIWNGCFCLLVSFIPPYSFCVAAKQNKTALRSCFFSSFFFFFLRAVVVRGPCQKVSLAFTLTWFTVSGVVVVVISV